MRKTLTILYVFDQQRSKAFYQAILQTKPLLDVPGMTEFSLNEGASLGLMPEEGIHRILGNDVPHPKTGNGIPRCELYLFVENPKQAYQRACDAGAKPISPVTLRNWGDEAGYVGDPDGHIIVFANQPAV